MQDLQADLRAAVADGLLPGVILLLEHPPVISLGTRRDPADLLNPSLAQSRGIEIAKSERGGQATIHAPGQLVSYPIVPIPRHDLRRFVAGLEEILRLLLAKLGVTAHRREGRPGLYVNGEKIASVGLRCHRWVASHGTSLNVNVDLALFDLIVACGEPGLRQTSLQTVMGRVFDMNQIKSSYLEAAQRVFAWNLAPLRQLTYDRVTNYLGLEVGTDGDMLRSGKMPTAGFEPATPGSGGQCSIP